MLTSHSKPRAIDATTCEPPGDSAAAARRGVSVVVPMYNEQECVEQLVASLRRLESTLGDQYQFEFVLVDDGSSDATVALLRDAVARRPHYRIVEHGHNRGIAAAIQTGLRAAAHETVVSMDCDGSYDPSLMGEMIPLLGPGVDVVTASPYHVDGAVENVPLWRLRLSRLASRLYGVVCRHKLSCYTSCFRVYRRSAVAELELDHQDFVGVAELLCKVLEQRGVVVEHPAMLRARTAGTSKMRVVRAGIGHLRLVGTIARRRLVTRRRRLAEYQRALSGAPAD
jgi:dolichol-phosphate mannosyltransferase